MIDFRYHIVSLTAVFLALAVGIVLGTTALKGPILTDLRGRVTSLAAENKALRGDVRSLQDTVSKQDSFADEIAPSIVNNRLAGRTVAIVSGPGGSTKDRDAVVDDLNKAGAKVVSRVRLANGFTDPRRSAEIKGLVAQLLPAGVQIPVTADGPAQAGAVLGAVLVSARGQPVSAASRLAVLGGFQSLGLLAVDGDVTGSADVALLIAPPPATGTDAKLRNASLLSFVTEFDRQAKATVLAGSTTDGDGNVITEVRNNSRVAKMFSTVDDIQLSAGRIAVIFALADELKGRSGHYGIGDGAAARLPAS